LPLADYPFEAIKRRLVVRDREDAVSRGFGCGRLARGLHAAPAEDADADGMLRGDSGETGPYLHSVAGSSAPGECGGAAPNAGG